MIERDWPDILLPDIELSGKKDGVDLAMKLKETQAIPFIFLHRYHDCRACREGESTRLPGQDIQ